jgi:hypothetical protein
MLSVGYAAEEAVAQLGEGLSLGKPVVVDNVTVWPVFNSKPQEAIGDYVTLAQAQEKNTAAVREMGAVARAEVQLQNDGNQAAVQAVQAVQVDVGGGGEVNRLVIENKGDKPIFVLAGTLVKGGKQDRQIAQDFIIPPGQTVPIDAYCVEHGRWTASREGKETKGEFRAQTILANQEVRVSGQYDNSQQAVWANVGASNHSAGKTPSTGTLMATIDDDNADSKKLREKLRDAVSERFTQLNKDNAAPVGLAYAVDGKIREIRTFAHNKIFNLYSDTLINTVALEGDLGQRKSVANKEEINTKPADAQACVALVKAAEQVKEEMTETMAGNSNGYKKNNIVNNGNAYLKKADGKASDAPVSQSWTPKQ